MLTEIRIFAPAKINIGLKVLPARSDGFHCIESIFQTVSTGDELRVRLSGAEGTCTVSCREMELPQKNTLTSAYESFCTVTGIKVPGVSVELIKRIPAGGGMGGGSSDAAALVRALEMLCGVKLAITQKDEIASFTGSDVFFFLHCGESGGGCALVTGRGEIVKPITPRSDVYLLMVFPDVHSSTKEAYALVDEYASSGKSVVCPAFADYETLYNSPVETWTFANSFTPAIADRYPEVGRALCALKKSGALYAEMSGSGSAVFGAYASVEAAEKARGLLAESGRRCITVRPFL